MKQWEDPRMHIVQVETEVLRVFLNFFLCETVTRQACSGHGEGLLGGVALARVLSFLKGAGASSWF